MNRLDNQIRIIDDVICRHFNNIEIMSRGMVSQDILSQMRNLVEHLMLKFISNGQDIDINYDNICKAINSVQRKAQLKPLWKFHEFLQKIASHYTLDEESSERLMLKYLEYLYKIRNLVETSFSLDILHNIEKFSLKQNKCSPEYYEKIVEKIEGSLELSKFGTEKFYVFKRKPFFVKGKNKVYYEITFSSANDHLNKTNRMIAFADIEVIENYAIRLSVLHAEIKVDGIRMPILIVRDWEVSIRECEYKNFTKIIRGSNVKTGYTEQKNISNYIKNAQLNLLDIVNLSDNDFLKAKQYIVQNVRSAIFINDLEKCRDIIKNHLPGENILSYLLYTMNNRIIKNQFEGQANSKLSGLYLKNGCIPFDKHPFMFSPLKHNPPARNLFESIDIKGKEGELLARKIRNNTEIDGHLFTSLKEFQNVENINDLVVQYNESLWSGHYNDCKLVIEKGQIFINGYKEDTRKIILKLLEYSSKGIQNYTKSVENWLDTSSIKIDDNNKLEALKRMFLESRVSLIYGSAGTGKTTLINYIAHFWANKSKLFLAQTNPAVDNLRRRVTASNCVFLTIAKFLTRRDVQTNYDLLVIDECSTVSNHNMREILKKANFKLLILVGDSYQIASIQFGNWFGIAQAFLPKTSIVELTTPYRTHNQNLLQLWKQVRNMSDSVKEILVKNNYSVSLDSSIFVQTKENEIILCLNYDGLYGINNINRFLQERNPAPVVNWGLQQFKVNDPILFNDSERFSPVIYNNLKGKIISINILKEGFERIQFEIELDTVLNEIDVENMDFDLLDNSPNGNSIIRFTVDRIANTDDDDNNLSNIIPFQVAYAVSIHKSQGLEYDSVKIVISDEIDEMITHNIFYTAITRAREDLKIYWTPETEEKILSSIKPKNNTKDELLLKHYLKQ